MTDSTDMRRADPVLVETRQALPDREAQFNELEQRVAQALEHAAKAGAEAAEASASVQGGLSATVRLGEVETIEHHRDRGISVTVFHEGRKGHASSADLAPASVLACVDRAVDIARFTEQDRCNGLADPGRLAKDFPDLDLWHPCQLPADKAIERALEVEAAARANDKISNSEGSSVSGSFGQTVYGNTNGFLGRSSGTRYGQVCVVIAGQGEDMQRDYWYDSQRRFEQLEAPGVTGRQAAARTVSRLGARKIDTTQVPVMFTPEVSRSLLGHFIAAVSGGALYRNTSFLKDKLGQSLFPDWFTLAECPFIPGAAGSAAFDAEGVATGERKLIEAGVLNGYVLSSYSARRLGLETTGNAGGIHNLVIEGERLPLDELMQELGTGFLVTEVMGQGVSMVTGDYSRGAAGFWVEDGQLAYPVEEVTVAGNLRDMFAQLRAVGDDTDLRGNIRSASMIVDGLTIAGS